MLTLLSGAFGLLGPLLPNLFKGIGSYFQDKSDKKHELAMAEKLQGMKLEEANVNFDQAKLLGTLKAEQENIVSAREHDSKSQDAMARILEAAKESKVFSVILVMFAVAQFLIVTVRPLLAHAVTMFWGATKLAQVKAVYSIQGDIFASIQAAWTPDDYAIFALILGFYFGDKIRRGLNK